MVYKMITPLEDGTPVQYVGVYVLRWRQEWGEPQVGFSKIEDTLPEPAELSWQLAGCGFARVLNDCLGHGELAEHVSAQDLIDRWHDLHNPEARDDHD